MIGGRMSILNIVRIVVKIQGPSNLTEKELIDFCEAIDVDGELNDKVLAIVVNHCRERSPEISELMAFRIE